MRSCLSAGPGATFDQATGVISARVSGQAGNNLLQQPDGLFVPTGAATISAGCGLTGNGSGSAPLEVSTGTWPYPCSPESAGGVIVCGSDGVLRGEPRGRATFTSYYDERDYPDVAVPSATSTVVDTFSATVTNDDPCRPALVVVECEADVRFVLPAGATAGAGYDNDEMWFLKNTGSSSMVGVHSQMTKVLGTPGPLAPGASMPISIAVSLGRGTAGAYYYYIQAVMRALMISL
ncbi:hypothetical protein [Streptomyces sp. NPDC003393]